MTDFKGECFVRSPFLYYLLLHMISLFFLYKSRNAHCRTCDYTQYFKHKNSPDKHFMIFVQKSLFSYA